MKKALRGILCAMLLLCFFTISASASQVQNQENPGEVFDFKEYFQEKLLPIGVGILTASCGLISSLASVKRALNSLKEEKETLSKRDKERERLLDKERQQISEFTEQARNQLSTVSYVSQEMSNLQDQVVTLSMEIDLLTQAIGIAIAKDKELVSTGNGKRLSELLEKSKLLHLQLEKRVGEMELKGAGA